MTALARETCEACTGSTPRLSATEARQLLAECPGWALSEDGTRITCRLTFPDFVSALDHVLKIGALAEAAGHHPDLALGWGYVGISLHTHAIGGLSRADFILAARIAEVSIAAQS